MEGFLAAAEFESSWDSNLRHTSNQRAFREKEGSLLSQASQVGTVNSKALLLPRKGLGRFGGTGRIWQGNGQGGTIHKGNKRLSPQLVPGGCDSCPQTLGADD